MAKPSSQGTPGLAPQEISLDAVAEGRQCCGNYGEAELLSVQRSHLEGVGQVQGLRGASRGLCCGGESGAHQSWGGESAPLLCLSLLNSPSPEFGVSWGPS